MFVHQGYPVLKVLAAAKVSSSSFYYRPVQGKKGRKCSEYTHTTSGQYVTNQEVIEQIEELLVQEFVDYGYVKVTHWLRNEKNYVINKKKVYRLMKEHKLLNAKRIVNRRSRKWVEDLVPQPEQIFEHLEVDIKYIYVHGKRRNAMQLTVIDVLSRWVMGYQIGWSMTNVDLIQLFDKIMLEYAMPKSVYVRNDNGSQFVANKVRAYFDHMEGVVQEFTRPATPEQNAHIEALHSIIEKLVCTPYYFKDLEELKVVMSRFVRFYNQERVHSGVGYTSPMKYIMKNMPGFNGGLAQPGGMANPSYATQ